MRKLYLLSITALLALTLAGCGSTNPSGATSSPSSTPSTSPTVSPSVTPSASPSALPSASPSESEPPEDDNSSLQEAAGEVIDILRERDMQALSRWIDPALGLRFSPYASINVEMDQIFFGGDDLPDFQQEKKLNWGNYDGSGEPIELTFRDYYEKFVYNQDFASAPTISIDELASTGNTPYNGETVYPGSAFVEYHYSGFDTQYEGMDWESLILVFLPADDMWRLAAIVHSQWTT